MNTSMTLVLSASILTGIAMLPRPMVGQGVARMASKGGGTCLPPFWGGVLAGNTRLEAVERLFGHAVATEIDGSEARTYLDPSKSRAVVIKFFDHVVTSLDVWDAAAATPSLKAGALISDWIEPQAGIGVSAGLRIGTSGTTSVRKNMGEPRTVTRRDGLEIWTYESNFGCELPSGLSFRFRGEQLVSFGVWSNEG
jgi:hypothetical protein